MQRPRGGHVTWSVLGVLLSALLTGASAQWTASQQVTSLKNCVNSGHDPQTTTLRDFEHAKPKRLWLQAQWRTQLPRSINLTVVTTVTVGRLNQLQAQCASWAGPLVAAVWVPLVRRETSWVALLDSGSEDVERVTRTLRDFHERAEALGACQMDLLLLHERVEEEMMGALMPINTLRNYGLLAATTPLVAMVDVDLLISASLSAEMADPARYAAILELTEQRAVVVLPAFETRRSHDLAAGQLLAESAVALDKRQLRDRLVAGGDVCWFQQHDYRWGHASTNYYEWYKDSTREPYHARPGNGYEPWFIVHRLLNPFYDQRFRGYGYDKISHVLALNATGFAFWVHPAAFLVHRPHPRSRAYLAYIGRPAQQPGQAEMLRRVMHDTGTAAAAVQQLPAMQSQPQGQPQQQQGSGLAYELKKVTGDMWEALRPAILSGEAAPLVDDAVQRCSELLPWWGLGSGPSGVADDAAAEAAAAGAMALPSLGGAMGMPAPGAEDLRFADASLASGVTGGVGAAALPVDAEGENVGPGPSSVGADEWEYVAEDQPMGGATAVAAAGAAGAAAAEGGAGAGVFSESGVINGGWAGEAAAGAAGDAAAKYDARMEGPDD